FLFLLFAWLSATAVTMRDERDWGTLARLLVAPGGFTRILLGKLAARFVVGVAQMIVLLAWAHFVFGVSLGTSPVGLLLPPGGTGLRVGAGRLAVGGPRKIAR